MRTHARAVVVGGGAVGAGIAYHLAKAGWTDTVPLERERIEAEHMSFIRRIPSSGGWSVAFGRSIGMGYVGPEPAVAGTRLKVRMQGRLWDAGITEDRPCDPQNGRLRADG